MPAEPVLARGALHQWEEPPISGTKGSGTIFFSGCSLKCVFCQNEKISHQYFGKTVTIERVREICRELVSQGAHNINFVNPTHYAHVVEKVLEETFGVPVVWNTGGYEKVETLKRLEGKVQIYLPDMKYLDKESANRYSGAPDYPEVAMAAIEEMVRQTGPCQIDEDGLLKQGVIIRHLILPGRISETKRIMDWVKERFPAGTVLFSLMSQYTPYGAVENYPEINRRLRNGEMKTALEYFQNMEMEGYCQERTAAKEEYIPPFDLTGI